MLEFIEPQIVDEFNHASIIFLQHILMLSNSQSF